MVKLIRVFPIMLCFVLLACGRAEHDTSTQSTTTDGVNSLANPVTAQLNNDEFQQKQLIIQANIQFSVQDVQQTIQKISQLSQQYGGYVAESTLNNHIIDQQRYDIGHQQQKYIIHYQRQARMVLRIPKAQIDSFLTLLEQQISFLNRSEFTTKDVALDIQRAQILAQIEQLKAQQLEQDVTSSTVASQDAAHQMAKTMVTDHIALSKQQALLAQIEQQRLQDAIQMSTIELNFEQAEKIYETQIANAPSRIHGDQVQHFFPRLVERLKMGGVYAIEAVLWLSQFWVLILIFMGSAYLWRKWDRKQQIPQQQNNESGSETQDSPPDHDDRIL